MKTAKDYIELIDEEYYVAKKRGFSRFSKEWGIWSSIMNRTLRRRTEGKNDIETIKLKYIFIYWSLMSELLEFHYKYKVSHNKKKEMIREETRNIKNIILTGDGLQPLSEEELVARLLKGTLK
ncbi:hypothetical protein AUJ63_04255 [Candidatus Pacearchaeota archaeon CG1_02_35_32]|nr:MAG: hypothetical protein AUJ63_04255 [Candidatus Pacearchaeota archaeon CG1_02_35_32]